MSLILKLKADSFYDDLELLRTKLFLSRIDISSKGFYIKSLGNSVYEICLPNPPENYERILRQWGEIVKN